MLSHVELGGVLLERLDPALQIGRMLLVVAAELGAGGVRHLVQKDVQEALVVRKLSAQHPEGVGRRRKATNFRYTQPSREAGDQARSPLPWELLSTVTPRSASSHTGSAPGPR